MSEESTKHMIEALDEIKRNVEAGRVKSLALVTELEDGWIGSGYAGEFDAPRLIGACEILKSRLLSRYDLNDKEGSR